MKKFVFSTLFVAIGLLFVGCGGGGGSSSDNSNALPSLHGVFEDFNDVPHNYVVYSNSYDGFSEKEVTDIYANLLSKSYDCSSIDDDVPYCYKLNPNVNTLLDETYGGNSDLLNDELGGNYFHDYFLQRILIVNSNYKNVNLNNIFHTYENFGKHVRELEYTMERCYAVDITIKIQPYIRKLLDAGFTYRFDQNIYAKEVGNFVFGFMYTTKSAGWE